MRERRRLAQLCALVWLVAVAILAGVVLRLVDGRAPPDDLAIVLLVAAAGLGAALALLWARIDRRVLGPVERLEREIDTILHAEPDRALELAEPGAIEALAGRAASLAARGDRARRELGAAVAATTGRLEDERSRLAAVLRDLSEGVVLCDASHRVLLFNDAARHALGAPAALGLGRKLFDAVADGDPAARFEALRDAGPDARTPVEMVFNGKPARMAAVVEPDGAVIGYVLSFAGAPPPEGAGVSLPPRPVFYDFGLLTTGPVPRRLGAGRLGELAFVVFDTETTGLRPDEGDEIVQIGAVRVVGGALRDGECFDTLVDPNRPIPASSTRFHGLTDDSVAGAPGIAAALAGLREFTGEAVLVAQNAAFDMRFVRARQRQAGVAFDMPVLDTMLLSAHLHPAEADHTLDGLAKRYGVSVAGRHTALGDARLTAEVLCRMLPLLAAGGVKTLDQADAACARAARRFRGG